MKGGLVFYAREKNNYTVRCGENLWRPVRTLHTARTLQPPCSANAGQPNDGTSMRRVKARPNSHSIMPGPRNCLRVTRHTSACETCGATPPVLHTPIRAAGRFCADCCPHCSLPVQPSRGLEAKP